MNNFVNAQFKGNRFAEFILKFPCRQRILMVTDGGLDFGVGGFGLSEFVSIIQAAGHTVSTAHRQGVGPTTIAGAFNFATAAPAFNTDNFDQLWMFGISTAPAIAANEQTTIARFMQTGGGVFSTGDHANLGAAMGANIPRVRRMREWRAEQAGDPHAAGANSGIPMATVHRHDTVVDPGADGIKQFDDQSDAIAQRIYPVYYANGPENLTSSWAPHPVLRHGSGAVHFLPDHPHESECLAARGAAGNFAGVEEWPRRSDFPLPFFPRPGAQVVAMSISGSPPLVFQQSGQLQKPPTKPHCFGAISVYDGDRTRVGRIVCDATWHHFVNVNLNGTGAGLDPTTGLPRAGLYAGGAPTPAYLMIQRYYLNTVRWLAPRNRRFCWPFLQVALARVDFEMLELALPEPHPCPWDPLIRIGAIAEEALTRHWGPGTMEDIVSDLLAGSDDAPTLRQLLATGQDAFDNEDDDGRKLPKLKPGLLPVQDLRRAVLGSLVNLIAKEVPLDDKALQKVFGEGHNVAAEKWIPEAVRAAESVAAAQIDAQLKITSELIMAIRARK